MPTSFPRSTYRHWAMFYGAALVLLAGWLLFEKRTDGQKELAVSMKDTLQESWQVMTRHNYHLLRDIQDYANDYRTPQNADYKGRAEKAWALIEDFERNMETEQLSSLQTSFLTMAESNALYKDAAGGFIDTSIRNFENYKRLKSAQTLVQSQGLAALILNYCAMNISGVDLVFQEWYPGFLPSSLAPVLGEQFRAEIVLSSYHQVSCMKWDCWMDGQLLPVRDGIARLRTTFSTPGLNTLAFRFRREQCRDGSVTEFSRDFHINVLKQCDSIPGR